MIDEKSNNQLLTTQQKLMFGLFCWGTQSHGQAENFKTSGYNQKYLEAKKAMQIGLITYSIAITLFIVTLIILRK
jgi:hypothetical protein